VTAPPAADATDASDALVARLVDARAAAPRTLLLVAHPDDETIGASALLARLGASADVAYLTDGAPRAMHDARAAGCATRAAYAELRRRERGAALALAGVGPGRVHDLGAVDQEAWRDLAGLARRAAALVESLGAEVLVTHAYEGGHPDHDAAAFLARAACALLAADGARAPAAVECTSYHDDAGAPGRLVSGVFRPAPGAGPEHALALDAPARARKAAMYACHASQAGVLAWLPPADVERFRRAPRYDFAAPPPGGPVWYERLGWPVRAADVAAAAAGALTALGLAGLGAEGGAAAGLPRAGRRGAAASGAAS
jgi:LmbE family N-acetylglucosaminyl deacetylase